MLYVIDGLDERTKLYCCCGPGECTRCGKCGNFDFRQKLHEQEYHLYLTLTGEAFRISWSPDVDDCVCEAMACAGYVYEDSQENAFELIHESIERGYPALARGLTDDWSLIVGCDAEAHLLLDDRATVHQVDGRCIRALIVTGKTEKRFDSAQMFADWSRALEDGFDAYDAARSALQSGPPSEALFLRLHAFVGRLAESRCFAAMALLEGLYGDERLPDGALHALWTIGGFFMEAHDECWRAWKAMGGNHIPEPVKNANRLGDSAVQRELAERITRLRRFDTIAALVLREMPGAPFFMSKP